MEDIAEQYIRDNRTGLAPVDVDLMQTASYGSYPYPITMGESWFPFGEDQRVGTIADLAEAIKEKRITCVSFYKRRNGIHSATIAVFPKSQLITM